MQSRKHRSHHTSQINTLNITVRTGAQTVLFLMS